MKFKPHPYQDAAIQHIIEHPACGLLIDMGLGKTVSTLTAIDYLINDALEVNKVLVIAPLKVAQNTWTGEIEKWDHTKRLTVSKVLGSEKERKQALKQKANIYLINRENIPWLVAHYGLAFPFDMVVCDESSSFKNHKAARFKALRQVRGRISRLILLTGTPIPNGLIDLWPQMYLVDKGQRLGETITKYRDRYFKAGKSNGHIVFKYNLLKGDEMLGPDIYEREIYDKIGDVCISMKAKDYLQLPQRIDNTTEISLSQKIMDQYKDFEKKLVMQLAEDEVISAANAAVLTNKLRQFSNGAMYHEDGKQYTEIHTEKIEALEEQIEAANGKPVLVFYEFKHDLTRILHHLKAFKPIQLQTEQHITDWNKSKIPVLLAHPASAGHGLNLQHGGHIIQWFCLPWSCEYYEQAVARLDRQGQTHPVVNNRLIVKDTMDIDVMMALQHKQRGQNALMEAVKARIENYKKTIK